MRRERLHRQLDEWERDFQVAVLGAKTHGNVGRPQTTALVLLLWNTTGIACRGVVVRLIALRAGLEAKPLKAASPARPMPLRLLPVAALDEHRFAGRSRPLARIDLAPYERSEIELARFDSAVGHIIVEHETGSVLFPHAARDYEFLLEVSAGKRSERFLIGLKQLDEDRGSWVAGLPRHLPKRG